MHNEPPIEGLAAAIVAAVYPLLEHRPLTSRRELYYRLVESGVLENDPGHYKALSKTLATDPL